MDAEETLMRFVLFLPPSVFSVVNVFVFPLRSLRPPR